MRILLLLIATNWAHGQQPKEPPSTFAEALNRLSSAPANACEYPQADLSDLEFRLFLNANNAVAQELNDDTPTSSARRDLRTRAVEALRRLEHQSADVNKSWPDEQRFHFEVIDLPPNLIVKMTYRNRATFSFFAKFQDRLDKKLGERWQSVGALDDHSVTPGAGYDYLDLFPLPQSPSKSLRFLAKFSLAGCGSGVGVAYYVYEWDPKSVDQLEEIIKLEGAVSRLDAADEHRSIQKDKEDDFSPVGKFEAKGTLLSLPYCWFSALDTWNNPSLCAVNSYDISGDRPAFVGRSVNRPDLLPIAKAIEYAQARDYPAVLAYCASPEVAQQMVRRIPPFVSAVGALNIRAVGPLRKSVELDDGDRTVRFTIEKHAGRWMIAAFRMD